MPFARASASLAALAARDAASAAWPAVGGGGGAPPPPTLAMSITVARPAFPLHCSAMGRSASSTLPLHMSF